VQCACVWFGCLSALPPLPPNPPTPDLPVLFWRERWHPLIRTALLSLFSNDSGLKTAMLCPLSPIYRCIQCNIIFFAHSLSSYGCVCNRNKLFYCFTVKLFKQLHKYLNVNRSQNDCIIRHLIGIVIQPNFFPIL
jgi:hypothetical protein